MKYLFILTFILNIQANEICNNKDIEIGTTYKLAESTYVNLEGEENDGCFISNPGEYLITDIKDNKYFATYYTKARTRGSLCKTDIKIVISKEKIKNLKKSLCSFKELQSLTNDNLLLNEHEGIKADTYYDFFTGNFDNLFYVINSFRIINSISDYRHSFVENEECSVPLNFFVKIRGFGDVTSIGSSSGPQPTRNIIMELLERDMTNFSGIKDACPVGSIIYMSMGFSVYGFGHLAIEHDIKRNLSHEIKSISPLVKADQNEDKDGLSIGDFYAITKELYPFPKFDIYSKTFSNVNGVKKRVNLYSKCNLEIGGVVQVLGFSKKYEEKVLIKIVRNKTSKEEENICKLEVVSFVNIKLLKKLSRINFKYDNKEFKSRPKYKY